MKRVACVGLSKEVLKSFNAGDAYVHFHGSEEIGKLELERTKFSLKMKKYHFKHHLR
jgi:hypothetical protein